MTIISTMLASDVWTDWPEAVVVESWYADYLVRRRELEDDGIYTYNDLFCGCFSTPITGTNPLRKRAGTPLTEETVIYYCQVRHRMEEIRAKVEAKLGEGYEPIAHIDGITKFRGVVLYPTRNMGGEYAHYEDARLVNDRADGENIAYLVPKGRRTRGYLVMGRKVLVLR